MTRGTGEQGEAVNMQKDPAAALIERGDPLEACACSHAAFHHEGEDGSGACVARGCYCGEFEAVDTETEVDHRAEAAAMLEGSNPHGSPTEALAHATLALVEQQRIANVIAYWQMHTPRTLEDSYVDQLEVKTLYHDDGVTNVDIEVRKALGLA